MDMTTANLKAEKPASYSFKVPATKAGKRFIEQLREYAHYPHVRRIRCRANGPRIHDGVRYFQDLPMEHAREIRVYLDSRSVGDNWYASYAQATRLMAEFRAERDELRERLDDAAEQVEAKDARIVGLMRTVDDLAQARHDAEAQRDDMKRERDATRKRAALAELERDEYEREQDDLHNQIVSLRAERLAYCAGAAQLANELQAELAPIPKWLRRLCAWCAGRFA